MGDVGDDYKAWKEIKKERRSELEPERLEFAMQALDGLCSIAYDGHSKMRLSCGKIGIDFYPFTGWFQGPGWQGRGINKLVKKLKALQ